MNCLMKFQEVNMKKIVVLFVLIFGTFAQAQYQIPEKPSLQTYVYDYAKLLSNNEKIQL